MKRKILLIIFYFIYFSVTNVVFGNTAKSYLNGMYKEGGKYKSIEDIVLEYELKAEDKYKVSKEEDLKLIAQGKIFYKYPYFLRIETEFLFHPSLQGQKLVTIKDGEEKAIFKEDFVKPLLLQKDERYPLITNFPFLGLLKYKEVEDVLYPVVVAYENIGSGELKGKQVAIISIIDKSQLYERYRIYLDTQTYFPLKIIYYPPSKDKEGIEVIFKGFSYVADGRIWAKKILIYKINKNQKYLSSVINITNMSINVGLTNDLFNISTKNIQDLPFK